MNANKNHILATSTAIVEFKPLGKTVLVKAKENFAPGSVWGSKVVPLAAARAQYRRLVASGYTRW